MTRTRAQRHGPEDVHLGADWIERWLPRLAAEEVTAYVALARIARERTYHPGPDVARALGVRSDGDMQRLLDRLEAHGLVEVVARRGAYHFHLRCRGEDGLHRAGPAVPSIKEAISFHKRMMEELIATASDDETDALRATVFSRYPELRDSYEEACAAADGGDGRPRWRLWLELSLHLMNRFEERFGSLKDGHADVFKEVSAQLLRLRLEVVERLTRDLLEHRDEIFPIAGEGWIAGIPEPSFVTLPRVRELSRKYRVGAEQIYLNIVEALQQDGLCVVDLDARGHACDAQLPSTTGLDEDEERYLFLHSEDLGPDEIEDLDRTLDRVAEARRRYADHLKSVAVNLLIGLGRRERLGDTGLLVQVLADRITEALDLVQSDTDDPHLAASVSAAELAEELARAQAAGAGVTGE